MTINPVATDTCYLMFSGQQSNPRGQSVFLLKKRKHHKLFSSSDKRKPGPKGPSEELIDAILDIKINNPTFGSPRIADMLVNICDEDVNKDVARRVINKYYKTRVPISPGEGPSWLTLLGHTKDSLWSVDMFR